MIELTEQFVTTLMRKRGELGYSTKKLESKTGVSAPTLRHIMNKDGQRKVRTTVYVKLSNWIAANV